MPHWHMCMYDTQDKFCCFRSANLRGRRALALLGYLQEAHTHKSTYTDTLSREKAEGTGGRGGGGFRHGWHHLLLMKMEDGEGSPL